MTRFSDLPSFATSPVRYRFNDRCCIKFIAAQIETERDDVRYDLRREGRELREEYRRKSLPVSERVCSKTTGILDDLQ